MDEQLTQWQEGGRIAGGSYWSRKGIWLGGSGRPFWTNRGPNAGPDLTDSEILEHCGQKVLDKVLQAGKAN